MRRSILPFSLLPAFLAGVNLPVVAQAPGSDAYRKYALTHEGDVSRGRKLFNDP